MATAITVVIDIGTRRRSVRLHVEQGTINKLARHAAYLSKGAEPGSEYDEADAALDLLITAIADHNIIPEE